MVKIDLQEKYLQPIKQAIENKNNPYNNQPIVKPIKVSKPVIPMVSLPNQASLNTKPLYDLGTKNVYNPYTVGKDLTELDPVYQESIVKSLSKPGLFGEKGIEYNLLNIFNKAVQLPQSMINAGGFMLDTLYKITGLKQSVEMAKTGFGLLDDDKLAQDTIKAIDSATELGEDITQGLKEVKFVQDRSQELLKKYEGKIGSVDKFTSDVLGNAIDMIPTLAIAYSTGGTSSMLYLFSSAGAKAEEEALSQGATEDEAFVYGVLNGGIEAGTEMLFSGIGGIAKGTMPKWSKIMSAKFSNVFQQLVKTPFAKAFVSQLVDVAGEGFEEVIAEVLGNYAKLVYTEEIKSGKELTDDALYAGLLGMFTSGFMSMAQRGTLATLETISNQGTIQNLSKEQSIALSRSLANKLNYDFEVLSQDDSIAKYGTTEKTKQNITSGNAFVVKESRQDGKSGSIVIVDRGGSQNILATSTMHEITHIFENTKTYNELTSLVKSHMGEEQYQEFVNDYAQLYKVEKDDMYKSGIRMSESEFIAQQIIQNQLFGLNSGMRTSFIQKLAGEKPKLFTRLSDNIDSFLNRMKTKFLDSSIEDDRNVLEYIEYMENLKMVFEQANDEYHSIKEGLMLEDELQPEVKMQKPYELLKSLDTDSKAMFSDDNASSKMILNFALGGQLKAKQVKLSNYFGLSEEEISTIFDTIEMISPESANDTVLLFETVNDALDGKFKQSTQGMSDKEIIKYNDLLMYFKHIHQYLTDKNVIDSTPQPQITSKVEQERLELAQNEYLKALENNPISLNGEVDAQDLMVLHNLTEDKLMKSLALGGFAMPSLAITKAEYPHSDFGEITVVFNKDILNDSPTFTSDAFTPRVPTVYTTFGTVKQLDSFYETIKKQYSSYKDFAKFRDYESNLVNGWYEDANSEMARLFSSRYEDNKLVVSDLVLKIYEDVNGNPLDISNLNNEDRIYRNAIDQELDKLREKFFKSYGAKEYFRNDVDLFTPSGNRRNPDSLLTESNLQTLVKHMRSKGNLVGKESNFDFGLKQRKALMNRVMTSANDVVRNKSLLNLEEDRAWNNDVYAHDEVLAFMNRNVGDDLAIKKTSDSLIDVLEDYITSTNNYTVDSINTYFKRKGFDLSRQIDDQSKDYDHTELRDYSYVDERIGTVETYAEVLEVILNNIKNKQVSYFESKPRRAVQFSEIEKVLVPKEASQELKDSLKYNGIPFEEYDYKYNENNSHGRLELIKNMKEVQFQLVSNFKEDSNGLELTDEQLTPIMLSKALDENGKIKVVNRRDKDGYYNIKTPFDTRTRKNAALVDSFIQNNNLDLINGLLSETDANLFLSFITEEGLEYDGITYNDNGSVGYIPLDDTQFYPIESLEYTNALLSDLKARSGIFEDYDNQVSEMQENAQKQTEQALKEFYQVDYDLINKFDITSQEAYESMEDFRDEVNQTAQDLDVEPSTLMDDMFNSYKESVERYSRSGFELYNRIDNKQKGIQFQLTPQQLERYKDMSVELRNEDGSPKILYHGSKNEFNQFELSKGGEFGSGIYLTDNKETASYYSEFVSKGENSPSVMSIYANIKNPYIINKQEYIKKTENITPNTFKNKLIKQGYDGIIGIGLNGVDRQIVAFYPNQIKSIDNLNPTDDKDIRFQLDPNNPLLNIYSPSLTKSEQDELQTLKGVDNAFGIIPGDIDYNRYVQLLEKEQKLVKFKKLLDVKEYDQIKKEYQKAKKDVNNESAKYDKQLLNTITGFVKGYRDTGKRTKTEWLFIASQYGSQYKTISQDDLLEQALYTWIVLNPNNKENLNRQGQSYVKFGVEEWIQETAKGAGGGTVQDLNVKPIEEQRIQYEEKIKQSRFGTTAQQTSTQEVKQTLEQDISNGKLNYQVSSDIISVRQANERISENGIDEEYRGINAKLKNGEMPTKLDIAIAEILIKKLSQERKVQETVDLITTLATLGTELGQAVQALSLINKLSPTGQLMSFQKAIKRIEKSYEKQGKPKPNLRIPQEYQDYFVQLEGKKQDLQNSQEEYNSFVEVLNKLESEVKSYEEQNKSIKELNQIEAQIDVLKEQQRIEREMTKRIDGLQLELDELNALPKVSDDLKQLQTGLKNEINSLKRSIQQDAKIQENIFRLESQLKVLQLEVGEDALGRITDLKQQIKDNKTLQKKVDKLNKMLEKMTSPQTLEAKIDEMKKVIAKQMPVNFMDKVNAWRYLSMLGNPRTHIRNILGNGFFYPVYVAKDVIGVTMEKFLPQGQRTKSISPLSDVELKQFVNDDFKVMQKTISSTTKYDLTMDLAFNKTIYKTQWLENIRNKNFDWLEKEDVLFMRLAYTHSLGMVIKARGWDYATLTEEQLNEARKVAIDDARKATYRDASKLATFLNTIEKSGRAQAFFMGTILPFKKTPINILKRGLEYSPISILVGIKQFAFDIKSGKATPAQAMDSLTTGISGIGLMGLGGILFSMGLLNVGDDDDETDKKKYYDRSLGKQRYSLNIFGGTYTIDWIVPAIMPIIVGGELAKAMGKESDETFANQVLSATFSILDPVFELSMLQGVTQTLTSYSSSGAETFGNIISTSIANYFGQFIPTLSGQIARIVDPVQRSTLGTKNSPITKFGEETLRKLANKLPLSIFGINPNAPVVDVRGNEVVNYENIFTRTLMNLFSPGYYKDGTLTPQDEEIIKIFEMTQEAGVIPKQIPRDYQFESKKYILDNQQTANFGKILGEISYSELDKLINSRGYQNISLEEKAKLFEKIYEYAWLKAKEQDFNSRKVTRENGSLIRFEDSEYENIKNAEKKGIQAIDYLRVKAFFGKLSGEDKQEKFYAYLNENNYDVNLYGELIGGYKIKSDLDIEGLDKIKIEGLEKLKIDGLEKLN